MGIFIFVMAGISITGLYIFLRIFGIIGNEKTREDLE